MTSTVEPTSYRLHYVDGIRALAALYVVMHHAYLTVYPIFQPVPQPTGAWKLATDWLLHGRFGVAAFIVVSGFSLMLSVIRNDGQIARGIRAFYIARARRILPPYYAAFILSLLLIFTIVGKPTGTHWDLSIPLTAKGILVLLLLLQDLTFVGGQVNHAFWSIAVEFHIYLLFPVLVWIWRKCGAWANCLILVVFGFTAAFLAEPTRFSLMNLSFISLFGMGMFAATVVTSPENYWQQVRSKVPWDLLFAISAAATVGITSWLNWSILAPYSWRLDFLIGASTAILLIAASRTESIFSRRLSWTPLVWVGGHTYSVYLIHAPLLQVVWQYALNPLHLTRPATLVLLILLGATVAVIAAVPFHRYFEMPFMKPHVKI